MATKKVNSKNPTSAKKTSEKKVTKGGAKNK
jgi:hypothetical protein